MEVTLTLHQPGRVTQRRAIRGVGAVLSVGRGNDDQIIAFDPSHRISRQHVRVHLTRLGCEAEVLGSTGVEIDGSWHGSGERVGLADGAVCRVGDTARPVWLLVNIDSARAGAVSIGGGHAIGGDDTTTVSASDNPETATAAESDTPQIRQSPPPRQPVVRPALGDLALQLSGLGEAIGAMVRAIIARGVESVGSIARKVGPTLRIALGALSDVVGAALRRGPGSPGRESRDTAADTTVERGTEIPGERGGERTTDIGSRAIEALGDSTGSAAERFGRMIETSAGQARSRVRKAAEASSRALAGGLATARSAVEVQARRRKAVRARQTAAEALPDGEIAMPVGTIDCLDLPTRLVAGRQGMITLRLGRDDPLVRGLQIALSQQAGMAQATVLVAAIEGDRRFVEIEPVGESMLALDDDGPLDWWWQITAVRPGYAVLRLRLTLALDSPVAAEKCSSVRSQLLYHVLEIDEAAGRRSEALPAQEPEDSIPEAVEERRPTAVGL
ncbi:MAG: hypothetical protein AAF899_08915 [Pseudomonadota bacterium]